MFTAIDHVAPASAAFQNGTIVVAVQLTFDGTTSDPNVGVVRYLSNGTPDTSFGSGGVVRVRLGNVSVDSVAIQTDGKIVLATDQDRTASGVQSPVSVVVARLDPDGTLDRTFGSGGIANVSFLGNQDRARVLLLQADGKILLGGGALTALNTSGAPIDAAFARLNANGSLDTTFGSGGKVLITGSGSTRTTAATIGPVRGLGLEADGSVLATIGELQTGVTNIHLAPNGARESLSLSGALAPIRSDNDPASSPLAFQSNGDVLVGDSTSGFGKNGIQVQMKRFTIGGAPDPSFSSAPFVFNPPDTNAGEQSFARAIAVQPNASIVIAGRDNRNDSHSLAQLSSTGSLDTTFGRGGFADTTFPLPAFPSAVNDIKALFVQADGKIIAVGETGSTPDGQSITDIAVARYIGP